MAESTPKGFLDLPRKVRDMVYKLVFPERLVLTVQKYKIVQHGSVHEEALLRVVNHEHYDGAKPLQIAKQIRDEILESGFVLDVARNLTATQTIVSYGPPAHILPSSALDGVKNFEIVSCHGVGQHRYFDRNLVPHFKRTYIMLLQLHFQVNRAADGSKNVIQTTHSWQNISEDAEKLESGCRYVPTLDEYREEADISDLRNGDLYKIERGFEIFTAARLSYIIDLQQPIWLEGGMEMARAARPVQKLNVGLLLLLQYACDFWISTRFGPEEHVFADLYDDFRYLTLHQAKMLYRRTPQYQEVSVAEDRGLQCPQLRDLGLFMPDCFEEEHEHMTFEELFLGETTGMVAETCCDWSRGATNDRAHRNPSALREYVCGLIGISAPP